MTLSRRKVIKILGISGLGAAALSLTDIVSAMAKRKDGMQQRIIPSTREKLPVVGLGTWQQFDVGPEADARRQLTEVLNRMREMGGALIDSSPMYGRAEEVIGALTAATGHADHYFYATKVWTSGARNGLQQMNESLQLLQRKKIDLMQVHNLQDWQTHLRSMKEWKDAGKIRYTGVTHYTESAYPQLEQIVRSKQVDFVQFNYSIREREAEQSLLNTAKDNGVAVIINEPFASGSLFGMVKGKALPPWAAEYDINSWAQFFLKYILAHPAVTCVIPGTSNPKHVADNMGAGYGRMPDAAGQKKMVEYLLRT